MLLLNHRKSLHTVYGQYRENNYSTVHTGTITDWVLAPHYTGNIRCLGLIVIKCVSGGGRDMRALDGMWGDMRAPDGIWGEGLKRHTVLVLLTVL